MLESSAERRPAVVAGRDGHVTKVFMAGAAVSEIWTVEGGAGGGPESARKTIKIIGVSKVSNKTSHLDNLAT
jgi:hypothetical protein